MINQDLTLYGHIHTYYPEKGFGTIRCDASGELFFVEDINLHLLPAEARRNCPVQFRRDLNNKTALECAVDVKRVVS